jgi:hypothetical protein
LVTVILGTAGPGVGLAIPEAVALVHPATVCVTVNVPAGTVIDAVVDPVDHINVPAPDAVNTEFPQLFTTETEGAEGIALTVIALVLAADVPHVFVAVTVIFPEVAPKLIVAPVVP